MMMINARKKNGKITARKFFVIAGVFLLFLLPLACTSQENKGDGEQNRGGGETVSDQKDQSPEPEKKGPDDRGEEEDGLTEITGKLSVKGSAPHTMLVLTTSGGREYQIVGDLEAELRDEYQYRTVTLKGEVVKQAVGPGFPAQFEAVKIVSGG